jgi:hypothetical protein
MIRILFLMSVYSSLSAFGQDIDANNFVLDQSKPYVYLTYDHIGPRKPVQRDEANTGLWIRVVNNCRIPIMLRGVDALYGDAGYYLDDEIVEESLYMQVFYSDREKDEYKKMLENRLERLKQKPSGYASETSGIIDLQPGKEMLFSIPINHVDDFWYFRIKFTFKLKRTTSNPYTYLPFHKYDIPKSQRFH